ncbi:MAG: hypothetical protein WA975_22520 [Mesorhizobium sp.]
MTKALIVAASLGLSISAVHACEFMHTAQDAKADSTVVASVSADKAVPMSVPDARTVLPYKAPTAQQPAQNVAD